MTSNTMPDTILIAMLANRFGRDMAEALSVDEMAEVRRRNATLAYDAGCCATHDFCDANMVMHPAFIAVLGVDPLDHMEDERLTRIWNAAWNIAQRDHFTARRIGGEA